MKIIFSVFLLLVMIPLHAQVKNETEKRIRKKEVPIEVKEWFKNTYEKAKKVKWYYQTDGDKEVYEVKLMRKNKKHSIEILPTGEGLNIEILIDFDSIESNAKKNIEEYLTANYSIFNITSDALIFLRPL